MNIGNPIKLTKQAFVLTVAVIALGVPSARADAVTEWNMSNGNALRATSRRRNCGAPRESASCRSGRVLSDSATRRCQPVCMAIRIRGY